MENLDLSITDIRIENENSINENDSKTNPIQQDNMFLERSKSKTKKDFNKFLFSTAQQKINKKLTINNPQSKLNKIKYIDKNNLNSDEIAISNSINKSLDDSTLEYKNVNEHNSVIIKDDSFIDKNNKNTEDNELMTENSVLSNSLYTNNDKNIKIQTADNILKRNEIESKRLETLVNSLSNMNESIKKRIISHMSGNSSIINTSSSTYGNLYIYKLNIFIVLQFFFFFFLKIKKKIK